MERVRLIVRVSSLTDKTHVAVATAIDRWTAEIYGKWSRVYRNTSKADMLADAALDAVAEAKERFPGAVINPLQVI